MTGHGKTQQRYYIVQMKRKAETQLCSNVLMKAVKRADLSRCSLEFLELHAHRFGGKQLWEARDNPNVQTWLLRDKNYERVLHHARLELKDPFRPAFKAVVTDDVLIRDYGAWKCLERFPWLLDQPDRPEVIEVFKKPRPALSNLEYINEALVVAVNHGASTANALELYCMLQLCNKSEVKERLLLRAIELNIRPQSVPRGFFNRLSDEWLSRCTINQLFTLKPDDVSGSKPGEERIARRLVELYQSHPAGVTSVMRRFGKFDYFEGKVPLELTKTQILRTRVDSPLRECASFQWDLGTLMNAPPMRPTMALKCDPLARIWLSVCMGHDTEHEEWIKQLVMHPSVSAVKRAPEDLQDLAYQYVLRWTTVDLALKLIRYRAPTEFDLCYCFFNKRVAVAAMKATNFPKLTNVLFYLSDQYDTDGFMMAYRMAPLSESAPCMRRARWRCVLNE